jgi:hypothetical protein
MRKIIFTGSDGALSIVHPVRNTLGETLTTDAEIEQRAWDKLPEDAINPQFVEADTIPTDRTFRNAWEDNGGINVNMPKAKDITKDRLRAERKPLLEAQDIAFQRAQETGADTSAIVKEKQRLRDVTKRVDALTSLDELKALGI